MSDDKQQQARDRLESLGVTVAQSLAVADVFILDRLITERDLFYALLSYISMSDPGGKELHPVGPTDVRYAPDGNTIQKIIGPWKFMSGTGPTFVDAVMDDMRKGASPLCSRR